MNKFKSVYMLLVIIFLINFVYGDGVLVRPTWDPDSVVQETVQKAIIYHHDGVEDMILQIQFNGNTDEFGWIVPVPSKPELSEVKEDLFLELAKFYHELAVAQYDFDKKWMDKWGIITLGKDSGTPKVEVVETKQVGVLDTAIIKATDSEALEKWFKENKYAVPEDAKEVFDHYVKKEMYFVAMKINAEKFKEKKKEAKGKINAVKFRFKTTDAFFPLKISSLNQGHGLPIAVNIYLFCEQDSVSYSFSSRCVGLSKREEVRFAKTGDFTLNKKLQNIAAELPELLKAERTMTLIHLHRDYSIFSDMEKDLYFWVSTNKNLKVDPKFEYLEELSDEERIKAYKEEFEKYADKITNAKDENEISNYLYCYIREYKYLMLNFPESELAKDIAKKIEELKETYHDAYRDYVRDEVTNAQKYIDEAKEMLAHYLFGEWNSCLAIALDNCYKIKNLHYEDERILEEAEYFIKKIEEKYTKELKEVAAKLVEQYMEPAKFYEYSDPRASLRDYHNILKPMRSVLSKYLDESVIKEVRNKILEFSK